MQGYNALDFNPNAIDPDDPDARGRYHATTADEYAYKYFAHLGPGDDERLSIWEIVCFEDIGLDAAGCLIIPSTLITKYSFLYARPRKKIHLVRLHNQNDGTHFLASIRSLQGDDFSITREWARYIRARIREANGLSFVSSAYGDSRGGGYAIVLFEELPHVTEKNRVRPRMIKQAGRVLGMGTNRGRLRTQRAMQDIRMTII